MDQGLTHLYIMKIKILLFLVCTPLFLCGQQILDLKFSHQLNGNYPPILNIEFGKKWWGIEAEVGYRFGKISTSVIDSTSITPTSVSSNIFDHKKLDFQWRLVGNFYPFTFRGAGQGLKLGVGVFDDVEVWRDPAYYEFVETVNRIPVDGKNDKAFKRIEYGFQIGYKRIFWKHLVAEASLMYTFRRVRDGYISYISENAIYSILVGYRFSFSPGE